MKILVSCILLISFGFTDNSDKAPHAPPGFRVPLRSGYDTPHIIKNQWKQILFVDDDAGYNLETYWETSFVNLDYFYDKWTVADSGDITPTASQMGAYRIVVWTTGADYTTTLVGNDTIEIGAFLDAGGVMWLSSQDVLWDIGPVSWMHLSDYENDYGCTQATGVGLIMEGASYATTGGVMYDYSDEITGDYMTRVEMQNQILLDNTIFMSPMSGTDYALFFNTFAFENINDAADRDDMMWRVISTLGYYRWYDVGSVAFLNPGSQFQNGWTSVIGVVKNYGTDPETYFVHCMVTDQSFVTLLDTAIMVSNYPGEMDTINFGWIRLEPGESYELMMATLLNDWEPWNDTLEQTTLCIGQYDWASWTPFSEGRSGPYAGFWDSDGQSYAYCFGGNPGPLASAMKYEYSTQTWTPIPDLPIASSYGGNASVGGKIYLISAWTGQNGLLTIFDCESETYSPGQNLPVPVADPAIAAYQDNYIYSIGGSNPPGWAGSGNVQVYDIGSDTWLTGVTQLPAACYVTTAAAGYIGNDTLIVSGGYDAGATNKTTMGAINPANPAEITWSTGTPHPGAPAYRCYGDAICNDVGDYWFIIAGGSPYTAQAHMYMSNVGWFTLPDKITACSNCGAVADCCGWDHTLLLTMGGYTGSYLNIFEVWIMTWEGIQEHPDDNVSVFKFSPGSPNPVTDKVRFTLSLPQQSSVHFQVFDIAGRQVLDSHYSTISQGEHALFWNLRDDRGREVPAGSYFYRLQAGEHSATGKIVVVK